MQNHPASSKLSRNCGARSGGRDSIETLTLQPGAIVARQLRGKRDGSAFTTPLITLNFHRSAALPQYLRSVWQQTNYLAPIHLHAAAAHRAHTLSAS